MPDEVVGGCIEIFENVWPNPQTTIELLENECKNLESEVHWSKAAIVGIGQRQNFRTNQVINITNLSEVLNNSILQNISNIFYTALLSTSNSYAQRYSIAEPFFHEHYQILRYNANQHYSAHYDGPTQFGRCISAICYLNDDYEGGELEFVNFKLKIKPLAGMMILFPSNFAYTHIAHPVLSGTKYAAVTWIRDRNDAPPC